MNGLSQENIDWAVTASENGSSIDFIASVLGVKQKRAATIIRVHSGRPRVEVKGRYVWQASQHDNTAARQRAEALFKKDDESIENDENSTRPRGRPPEQPIRRDSMFAGHRRRFLLAVWHARHWDLIWFLTQCGMSRRTLEMHFGKRCVAYTRGEGFDWECAA